MSNEKFTPGEWEIEERQAHCNGFEMYGFAILTKTKRICMCQTDDPENIPAMQANAHLISAAPDMYRMLEFLHTIIGAGSIALEIDKVLKKARGEQ